MAYYGIRVREQLHTKVKNYIGTKYLIEQGLAEEEADNSEILALLSEHYKGTLELLQAAGFLELKVDLVVEEEETEEEDTEEVSESEVEEVS